MTNFRDYVGGSPLLNENKVNFVEHYFNAQGSDNPRLISQSENQIIYDLGGEYPNKLIYEGEISDNSTFHGKGVLTFILNNTFMQDFLKKRNLL